MKGDGQMTIKECDSYKYIENVLANHDYKLKMTLICDDTCNSYLQSPSTQKREILRLLFAILSDISNEVGDFQKKHFIECKKMELLQLLNGEEDTVCLSLGKQI